MLTNYNSYTLRNLLEMLREILEKFLEAAKKELIAVQQSEGLVASGKSINSYEVDVKGTEEYLVGTISNTDYWFYVDNGRAAGKFPPIQSLKKWCEDKGLFSGMTKEYQRNGLAFVIARSIAKRGTLAHQIGGNNLFRQITEQRIKVLQDALFFEEDKEITKEIVTAFNVK